MISNNTFITIFIIGINLIIIYSGVKYIVNMSSRNRKYILIDAGIVLFIFGFIMLILGFLTPIVKVKEQSNEIQSCSMVYDSGREEWSFKYTCKQKDDKVTETVKYKDVTFVSEQSCKVKTVSGSFLGWKDCILVYLPQDRIDEINSAVNNGSLSEAHFWSLE